MEKLLEKALKTQVPAIQAASRLAQHMAQVETTMVEFAVQAARVAEAWEKTKVSAREVFPILAAHGWLMSPRAHAGEPRHLHELYEEGGIDAVEAYLLDAIDSEDCSSIVAELKARPIFASWVRTFDKALEAQNRGDHELAIPIWLAALDRACSNQGLTTRNKTYSQPSKKKRRAIEQGLMPSVSGVYQPMMDAWVDVLSGFSLDSQKAGPAVLNRHAVMHGQRPDIGGRKDAIQCLLALQVLTWLLDVRDRASAR